MERHPGGFYILLAVRRKYEILCPNSEKGGGHMTVAAKKKRQWQAGVAALASLLAILLVMLCLLQRTENPEQATTADTQLATEPTLPPPEANPYGPTDFQYDGKYLTCIAGASRLGIDVSAHQKEIDWTAVAEAGIRFVMIRVGYRGYETGELILDEFAQRNYQGARAAGLDVGVYLFAQAISVEEAREEAEFLLDAIDGWEVALPVVYDWEYVSADARTGAVDKRTVTDCTVAFCEAVQKKNYTPMVYFNRHQAQDFLHLEELTDYPFWLAMYSDRMTYPYRVQMWQYTQTGRVPGIQGDVDINLWLS